MSLVAWRPNHVIREPATFDLVGTGKDQRGIRHGQQETARSSVVAELAELAASSTMYIPSPLHWQVVRKSS